MSRKGKKVHTACSRVVSPLSLSGGLLLVLVGLAACTSLTTRRQPAPPPAPGEPRWQTSAFREHLRFFHRGAAAERMTGSEGFDRAAAYAAARMLEFGLQPGLESDYVVPYTLARNRPTSARLGMAVPPDTFPLYRGVDFMPAGITGTARVTAEEIGIVPSGAIEPTGDRIVMMPAGLATPEQLRAMRASGTEAVLMVGPLRPGSSARSLAGLAVLQVTRQTAARLLSTAPSALSTFLKAEVPFSWNLPRQVYLEVASDYQPYLQGTNIIGMVAGEHPEYSKEAVLVVADLDAPGSWINVNTLDFGSFGVGAAALLEVARKYEAFSEWHPIPERTAIFGVLSGRHQEHAGLRGYLRNPLWALESTRAVIYVGLSADEQDEVQQIVSSYDLPLYTVPAADSLFVPEVVLDPGPTVLRNARLEQPGFQSPPSPDMGAVLDSAAAAADSMARAAHRLLLPLSDHPGRFQPVIEDTLEPPEVTL